MTMDWIEVERLPLALELTPVLKFLHTQHIPCRVTEDSGEQVVWLLSLEHRVYLKQALDALSSGQLPDVNSMLKPKNRFKLDIFRQVPVTALLVLFSLLGAVLVHFDVQLEWVKYLTFTDFSIQGNSLYFFGVNLVLDHHEYWRLISPMFLHFGLFHILFNGLWLWEMGRRIETNRSGVILIFITLFTSLSANFLQFFMAGPSLFGGMSGVLYGYLGYIWMWQKYNPKRGFNLPSGVIVFMLLWLLLCFTGIVDRFMDGQVANGAHLGGLMGGMSLGLVGVLLARLKVKI